jgi:hypothetical protein
MKAVFHQLRLIPVALVLFLAAVFMSPAAAQDSTRKSPLFDSHEVLRVKIEAPFSTLMFKRDNDEYQDGVLRMEDRSGAVQSFDLKLRTRGHYRADAKHCRFAPLLLNFRKKQVQGTVLDGQDKLKLVTHCENRSAYEQSLLLEYLAYRILNQLTDLSFRVRLLQVEYVDPEKGKRPLSRYAFLVEDDKELSERIGMPRVKAEFTTAEQLYPQQAVLIAVFQYLIGNTDYSAIRGAAGETCCHNAVLFNAPDGAMVPVPYDFDLAGLVDAPYATPNPSLKIRDVKQRLYRGYCIHNAILDAPIDLIFDRRNAVMQLLQDQEGLNKASKRSASRFVEMYFDRVEDSSSVERYLLKECL